MAADPRFVEALSRSEIFYGIPKPDLAALIAYAKLLHLTAGGPALEENQLVEGLHIIVDGAVEVRKGETPVAKLEKGSFFGEISLFSMNIVASATVVPMGSCSILMIDRQALDIWLQEHPEDETRFFRNLCVELCHRLRATTEQLVQLRPEDEGKKA